jgi:hypothetical protein
MLGGPSVGMNAVPNGHHSAMDIQSHHPQRPGQWVNNSNLMNSHQMMGNNISSMSGMNHSG